MSLRLAMLQMSGEEMNPEANRGKAEHFCRDAKARSADIALMPEMFNLAYPVPDKFRDPDHAAQLKKHAEPVNGPFVSHFAALAKELRMAIGVCYLESRDRDLRNSMTLINPHGDIVGTFSKFHTCKFSNLEYDLTPGDDFYVWDLDTSAGVVKVGCMICYDREFPESARILMLKGAEVVLVPNACKIEENRTHQLRTRAFENEAVFAMANYAAPTENGNSIICGHDGSVIAHARENERILYGDVDLEALRKHQREGIWGISFRRPRDYGILTQEIERPGYGAKNAEERAAENLPPVKGQPFEKGTADPKE
jgi:predicted amidohydrolase